MKYERGRNPKTNKEQVLIQPKGLPAIWITIDAKLCERCKPFNQCLSFISLSDKEWQEVTEIIKETPKSSAIQIKCLSL